MLFFCVGVVVWMLIVFGMFLGKFIIVIDGVGERIVRCDISILMFVNYCTDFCKFGDFVN